jgi:RNA polymerase sigma-70 factor (ECF subfamily)
MAVSRSARVTNLSRRRSNQLEVTDEALMAGAAAGDRRAFEKLYERHKTAMFNYFLRATGSRELAEDLFQELFLRVFRARESYQPREPFRVWLFTLARNLLRDRWRQLKRKPDWEDSDAEPVDPEPGPEAILGRHQEIARVRAAVLQLPPALREVLILSRYHGLSFAEIGQIMSCTEGAARVRAFRAVERLREILAEPVPLRLVKP